MAKPRPGRGIPGACSQRRKASVRAARLIVTASDAERRPRFGPNPPRSCSPPPVAFDLGPAPATVSQPHRETGESCLENARHPRRAPPLPAKDPAVPPSPPTTPGLEVERSRPGAPAFNFIALRPGKAPPSGTPGLLERMPRGKVVAAAKVRASARALVPWVRARTGASSRPMARARALIAPPSRVG